MCFLGKLFRKKEEEPVKQLEIKSNSTKEDEPEIEIPPDEAIEALELGWYWSENKDEFQMAKIAEKDRATHFYVVGATGTGKTKFLEFLIKQDINNENGFGVIDPHGDLIEDIKGFLALKYADRRKIISDRVVLIDPTDPDFTVTFNPLEKMPNISVAEQANELVSAFKNIWKDSWGARMEEMLTNSFIALSENNMTLAELPSLLTDFHFRNKVSSNVKNPITRQYLKVINTWSPKMRAFWTESTLNKINAFLVDERIRHILCNPKSSFNLREIIDNKKILLINLDKGKLKDAADILGSLLMSKIQMAAFSRSDIPESKRIPFYLYIDEFQNFASESFSIVLSEARKYRLRLIMAHQILSQIPTELRDLILGNTGIQAYFRLNRKDAQLLAKEAFEYSGNEVKSISNFRAVYWSLAEEWEHHIEELQDLPLRVCYVKHKIEGGVIPISTVEIEPSWEVLGRDEDKYREFIKSLPFGKKYLALRKTVASSTDQRQKLIKEEIEAHRDREKKRALMPPSREIRKPKIIDAEIVSKEEKADVDAQVSKEKEISQHRYLQTLIKKTAEEKGYKAVIEQMTPDGSGKVDVSLERNGKKIACEISLTTTGDQELKNIEKCLGAGYEKVILCSPEKKTLENVKALVSQKLKESDQKRVFFFQPEELFFYLEDEVAAEASKEERVKGYKVKVHYKPVKETEKKTKREAVAKVILQALRRMKGGK